MASSQQAFSLIDPCDLLAPALEIAIEAGRRILEVYQSGFHVEQKGDSTPVTEADMAANWIIQQGLSRLTPHIPVLTEESACIAFEERSTWRRYWLADPMDGTREFIKRSGEFSVNIALIDSQKPVLGVVYAPILGYYFYACHGQGAYKREGTGLPQRIRTRQLQGDRVIVATTERACRNPDFARFLANLGEYEIVPMGSVLKACLVAEGRADIYVSLGTTSEWDTAAAQVILEEAGGHLTDTRMQPLRYNCKSELANPHFFAYGDNDEEWSEYL